MRFHRETFDDSVRGDDGSCEVRYVGAVYTFTLDTGAHVIVRAYDDEPGLAYMIQPTTWDADWLESADVRPMRDVLREAGIARISLYDPSLGVYNMPYDC